MQALKLSIPLLFIILSSLLFQYVFADLSVKWCFSCQNSHTIEVGETITWKNTDSTVHTVTSDLGDFASEELQPQGSFSILYIL